MKISSVKALIKEEDILSLLKDYIKVDGLSFERIEIKELINVYGVYKKVVPVPFKATIGVGNINGNTVNMKIFDVNVGKIGVMSGIKNFALKKFLGEFSEYGIEVDKDNLALDLSLVSKFVPYVYFKLNKINIIEGALEVDVEDIVYAQDKETISIDKDEEAKDTIDIPIDGYSSIRKNVKEKLNEKVPDKYEKIVEYAMIIPDITVLLWRLFRDKRVKIKTKAKVIAIIGYLASPIDIVPDFIPFIGSIDDVAIAFYGLNSIINEVPKNIILENWQGNDDIVLKVKEVVSYVSKIMGSENVGKLICFVKKLGSHKNLKNNQNFAKQEVTIDLNKDNCFEEAAAVNEKHYDIH